MVGDFESNYTETHRAGTEVHREKRRNFNVEI